MGAFIVVVIDPFVEIILQLLDGLVDLLSGMSPGRTPARWFCGTVADAVVWGDLTLVLVWPISLMARNSL